MFSNETERQIFFGILIAVIVLSVVAGISYWAVCVRNRNRMRDNTLRSDTPDPNAPRRWLLFKRTPMPDMEKAKPKISPPAAFRTLELVERKAVESSEKQTVAQNNRNILECAGNPRVFGEHSGNRVDRPARKWITRNPDGTVK